MAKTKNGHYCQGPSCQTFCLVFEERGLKHWQYYVIGYGFPLLVVTITLISTQTSAYQNSSYCWLNYADGAMWSFSAPVLAIILVNIMFLAVAVYKSFQSRNDNKRSSLKKKWTHIFRRIFGTVSLIFILGITWISGFFYWNTETIVFAYLFTILNSFQGLIVLVTYCLISKHMNTDLRRKWASNQNVRGKLHLPRRFGSKKRAGLIPSPVSSKNNFSSETETIVDYPSSCEGVSVHHTRNSSIWQYPSLDSTIWEQQSRPNSNTTNTSIDYINEDSTQYSQNVLMSQEQFQNPAWKQNSMKSYGTKITERIESQTSCENHFITSTMFELQSSLTRDHFEADDATAPLQNDHFIMEDIDDPLEKMKLNSQNKDNQDHPAHSNSIKRSGSLLNRQYNRIKTIIEWFENNMLS